MTKKSVFPSSWADVSYDRDPESGICVVGRVWYLFFFPATDVDHCCWAHVDTSDDFQGSWVDSSRLDLMVVQSVVLRFGVCCWLIDGWFLS